MKKVKTIYKNGSKIIKFPDTEIEEYEFHQYKKPISTNDIDINKIVVLVSFPLLLVNKIFKIGYKDGKKN